MTLILHQTWNRYQWAGDRDEAVQAHRDAEREPAPWNPAEMVADRQGLVRRPVEVDRTSDGLPHGFSGFGISGIGGQRWALAAPAAQPPVGGPGPVSAAPGVRKAA